MGLSPPTARGIPLLSAVLPAAQDWHPDRRALLPESARDDFPQFFGELMTRDEYGGLRRDPGLVEVALRQAEQLLAFLGDLIVDCRSNRLSRLSETRRAFDE